MQIYVDTREKARAIKKILAEFERQGVKSYSNKLDVGDYMSLDNARLVVDRKQNLTEVCSNMCQQHRRFREELVRAQSRGIQLVILVEHGETIRSIDDVEHWKNPRLYTYCKKNGIKYSGDVSASIAEYVSNGGQKPPVSGETLARQMRTMSERYGVCWEFCSKTETGQRIIEILGDAG